MVDRVVSIVENTATRVELARQFSPMPSQGVINDFLERHSPEGTSPEPAPPMNVVAHQASKVGPVLEGLMELDRLVGTVWSSVLELGERLAPVSGRSPQPAPMPEYPRINVDEGSPETLKHIAAIHSQLVSVFERVQVAKMELAI